MFDDCDEVRNKLTAFFRTNRLKQTPLLKMQSVNSSSYRNYLAMKGKTKGSGNSLYPKAYRFFENLRLLEGRPKSKHRQGAERWIDRATVGVVHCTQGHACVSRQVGAVQMRLRQRRSEGVRQEGPRMRSGLKGIGSNVYKCNPFTSPPLVELQSNYRLSLVCHLYSTTLTESSRLP